MILPKPKSIIANVSSHRYGKCNICGKRTIFWAIDFAERCFRNSMICFHCGSSARNRHVAQVVIENAPGKSGSETCASALAPLQTFKMLNTDPDGSMARNLGASERYVCSGYYPGVEPGKEMRPNVYCQDISQLTFADCSFDIVVTEDVLEHVRKSDEAFAEIYRVLKPGGYHVFTVPFFFHKKTLHRVKSIGDEDQHILPPEYHYDSLRGEILSYRTFGFDLFESLYLVGFTTEVHFSSFFDRRLGIYDSFVFSSRK